MTLSDISIEFGKLTDSFKEVYAIHDVVLFGSLAKRHPSPRDIDVMFIHDNSAFEIIQLMHGADGCSTFEERVNLLNSTLVSAGYPSLTQTIASDKLHTIINQGVLNLRYLHCMFFTDEQYFRKEIARNSNPYFFQNVMGHGLLWNAATQQYDIPIQSKYNLLG